MLVVAKSKSNYHYKLASITMEAIIKVEMQDLLVYSALHTLIKVKLLLELHSISTLALLQTVVTKEIISEITIKVLTTKVFKTS